MRFKQFCPIAYRCGGCDYAEIPYEEELEEKMYLVKRQVASFGPVAPIMGMKSPCRYRDKVQAAFGYDMKGNIISGLYKKGSHHLTAVKDCALEFEGAEKILSTIRKLMKSFRLRPYNEDTFEGDLRHVLLRRGHKSGEILCVLVFGNKYFKNKKEFIGNLVNMHPEITTVCYQINGDKTSMVLNASKIETLYGRGYIEDELCGLTFRISPSSFYQINVEQTEKLYNVAIAMARLTGKERVLDAYCGTGTIGLVASRKAKEVIGVELNRDAVKDARINAERNNITNAQFIEADCSVFMKEMAKAKEHFDVVFMDPPRAGSDERFLSSLIKLNPDTIVYVSCNPETLRRDLLYLEMYGPYRVYGSQPVDMFPRTEHVETVCLLTYS
ncbi:MAG: 23S rRNA (uracil(1939)-C(5))-methyltransferase RlmD [Sphaerochaetaceae bacterium]|nr:23S rRNA (uracil(1939)-C(5))-methyltransferase RlmD [Sphaerochaetaceae bacterium]